MNAGRLDTVITIQQPTTAPDATYGEPVTTWTDLGDEFARVDYQRADESVQDLQRTPTATATVRVRWRGDVRADMRAVIDGEVWRITGVVPVGRRRWLDLLCAQTPPGEQASNGLAFDVILAMGQSNMAGRGVYDAAIDTESDRVWQFGCDPSDGTYRTAVDTDYPLLRTEGNLTAGHLSLSHSFAKAHAARTGRRVMLVPVCQGNTALVYGTPPWAAPAGSLYQAAVAQANLAITAALALHPGSVFAGCIWMQGERDADNSISQAAYQAALDNLIGQIRANVTGAANSWFVVGQMVPEATATRPGTYAAIDAAHLTTPARVLRTATAPGASGNTVDNLHYNAAGCRLMGPRFAAAVPLAQANV